jgi:hypothetical protein
MTDASGRFAQDLAEPISNACWILTEKDGLAPEKVRVLDACASGGDADFADAVSTWWHRLDAERAARPGPGPHPKNLPIVTDNHLN